MKKLFLAVIICMLASGTFAAAIGREHIVDAGLLLEQVFDSEGKLRPEYGFIIGEVNSGAKKLPEPLLELFGNERINLTVKMENDSEELFGIVSRNREIESISRGFISEPTMLVEVQEAVVWKIADSSDPLGEFVDAFNSGKIKYAGVGVGGAAKSTAINWLLILAGIVKSALSFLGSLFGLGLVF